MFNIAFNGIITVTRGDSFTMPLTINMGNELMPVRYTLQSNDVLYFAVMEPNQPFETALIRKKYTAEDVNENGDVVIRFRPQDTQCVLPGKYYYQAKLQTFNSSNPDDYDVATVVDKTLFWVQE